MRLLADTCCVTDIATRCAEERIEFSSALRAGPTDEGGSHSLEEARREAR
jgi:hypothetical protein